jgi:Tol biopolymer transport system component
MKIQAVLFALFATLITACAPKAPTPAAFTVPVLATVPAGAVLPALKGKFVFALGDGSLMVQDVGAKEGRMVFDPKDGTYADFPAFSPDGKLIAFSTSSVKPDGSFQYDIRGMNADGSNPRVLAVPDNAKAIFVHPAWSADGKDIFFTQSYAVPPAGDHSEIDRVSASGGKYGRVLDDAREAEASSDGKKIAYYKLDSQTFASSLWVANLDGSGAKLIVDTQAFSALYGARFSPDSHTILFTASGSPKKKLPGVAQLQPRVQNACAVEIFFTCWVESASAHGLPWDLWLANLDGSKFTRLTDIGADSPSPAWSSDGKLIAFFEASGIYVLDRDKKIVFPVINRGGYGGFDWK